MTARLWCWLIAAFASGSAWAATPTPPPVVFAIGANGNASDIAPLRYADDDAVEATLLYGAPNATVFLHAQLDDETQARFPLAAAHAKSATQAAISRSVKAVTALPKIRSQTVIVWVSGHGIRDSDGHPSLLLDDGPVSSNALDELLIAPLAAHAHRVLVVIDTCFAGGLVRARAGVDAATADEVENAFANASVRTHPNVAAIFGASPQQRAYEWEAIGAGVFSATLRAGLRGAADVNGDTTIKLDELVAFGRAAGANVAHQQARPSLHVIPAAIERNLTVFSPDWRGTDVTLSLAPLPPDSRYVEVRTINGRWLASLSLEPGFSPLIFAPADVELLLKADDTWFEVVLNAPPPPYRPLMTPSFFPRDATTEKALKDGLFRAAFGPAFFGGFLAAGGVAPFVPIASPLSEPSPPYAAIASWSVASVAAVGAAILGGFALASWIEFGATDLQVPARDALARAAWFTGGAAGVAGVAIGGAALGALLLE